VQVETDGGQTGAEVLREVLTVEGGLDADAGAAVVVG